MSKGLRILTIGMSLFFISGCASYMKRQQCEKMNWTEYGKELALKGQRPGEDTLVQECRKVEANISEMGLDQGFKAGMEAYCKPDQAYATGKKGQKLNLGFCEPSLGRMLTAKHTEGVKAYCAVDNGFAEGASGRAYTGICPANLEASFKKEYNRGRKKYVLAVISDNEAQIRERDNNIHKLQRESDMMTVQLALLPQPQRIIERVYDPVTRTYRENVRTEDHSASRRSTLQGDLDNYRRRINGERNEQDKLRKQISEHQRELAALE